jgi:predicted RNA-binding protein with RPS1 domain
MAIASRQLSRLRQRTQELKAQEQELKAQELALQRETETLKKTNSNLERLLFEIKSQQSKIPSNDPYIMRGFLQYLNQALTNNDSLLRHFSTHEATGEWSGFTIAKLVEANNSLIQHPIQKNHVDAYRNYINRINRLLPTHQNPLLDCRDDKHKPFTEGEVVLGRVLDIKPYGAYIDIGGVIGLLHISEISDQHIETPHTVLNVDDLIRVMIIDLDPISLSTKALAQGRPTWPTSSQIPQRVIDKAEEIAASYKKTLDGGPIGVTAE